MSGTSGFDLTTLVGYTFPGLNVAAVAVDYTQTVIGSQYNVSQELSDQGETRRGLSGTTFIVTAATNGPPTVAPVGIALDPSAIGTLTVQETTPNTTGQPVNLGGPFLLNVLGYSGNGILTGVADTYGLTTGDGNPDGYESFSLLSDVNIGLHVSDDPTPPVYPQTLYADPTVLGYVSPVPCFAAGTPILTPTGERPVEALQAGDTVLTVTGEVAVVRWVGHRVSHCSGDARPVRIAAHSFGPGRPHRPIVLSPDHAVFVDGVLVPVHLLVDGVAITRTRHARITYHHVELDRHDVLLAAGLPAESYLDSGNRHAFAQGSAGRVSRDPDFLALSWEAACAPLVLHGAMLDGLRARLAQGRPETSLHRN